MAQVTRQLGLGLGALAVARRTYVNRVSLALQDTLVPPITYHGPRVEAHGQSIPKDGVGGDLVDLVVDGRDVIAYVADVSGHGLRAGVLMGMIKTAIRYGLLLGQSLAKLLDGINSVLPSVKEPNMFATLAALRFDSSNAFDYISAGHVPLLHYRRRRRDVVRYSMSQFPLGLFPAATYLSRRIRYEPGDIFALVTDGIVELAEDQDADLGLDLLTRTFLSLPHRPLPDIVAAILAEVDRHGAPQDDQSVLLVRAVAENDAGHHNTVKESPDAGVDDPQSGEARWSKLLEDLAEELARE